MTVPFQPQGGAPAPAPGNGQFGMPAPNPQGQQAPVPQNTVVRTEGGIAYPPSAIPPAPQPQGQQPWTGQVAPSQPATGPGQMAPAQQQQFVQQSQAAPSLAQQVQLGPQTVLDGPGIPQELRGMTVEQFGRLYQGMRQTTLQALGQQPQLPQPPTPPPAPQAATPSNPQGSGQWDWKDPAGSMQRIIAATVPQIIQQTVGQQLAPVTQQATMTAINAARAEVAAAVGPRWAQIEAAVYQKLQGVDPQHLQNPNLWREAANAAAGEMVLRGATLAAAPQVSGASPAGAIPITVQPGTPHPVPPINSFFTETPGGVGQAPPAGMSAYEMEVMQGFGITDPNKWLAWKQGQAMVNGGMV